MFSPVSGSRPWKWLISALYGLKNVGGTREGAGLQSGGGGLDAAGAVDELQLDMALLLEAVGGLDRHLVVLGVAGHEIVIEGARHGLGLFLQAVPDAAVIVAGHPGGEHGDNQHQQHQNGHDGVDNPPLPQAANSQCLPLFRLFVLCHGLSSSPMVIRWASGGAQNPHLYP